MHYNTKIPPNPTPNHVKNISKQLVGLIENKDVYKILPDDTFGEDLLNFYNAVTNINITQNKPLTKDYTFVRHYVTQPYFEVQGTTENKLNIKYYDDKFFLQLLLLRSLLLALYVLTNMPHRKYSKLQFQQLKT